MLFAFYCSFFAFSEFFCYKMKLLSHFFITTFLLFANLVAPFFCNAPEYRQPDRTKQGHDQHSRP